MFPARFHRFEWLLCPFGAPASCPREDTVYSSSVHTYAAAVALSVLGSLGGLLTASTFLLLGDSIRIRLVPWLISYAVGTLLVAPFSRNIRRSLIMLIRGFSAPIRAFRRV